MAKKNAKASLIHGFAKHLVVPYKAHRMGSLEIEPRPGVTVEVHLTDDGDKIAVTVWGGGGPQPLSPSLSDTTWNRDAWFKANVLPLL